MNQLNFNEQVLQSELPVLDQVVKMNMKQEPQTVYQWDEDIN